MLPWIPRVGFLSRVLRVLLMVVAGAFAQSADQVFARFMTATSGWQDLSFSMSMTTRMMGQNMSMQAKTVMDRSGRSYQEMLNGPMRIATVVRGDTIQTKDLQTGKVETKVLPGGGQAALEQMDPGARLEAIRKKNRFQVESLTADQTVVRGTPYAQDKGYTTVKIAFANETGMPKWCELQDSTSKVIARMEFQWEAHGAVQVMKQMLMTTSPVGKAPPMVLEMSMSSIRVNRGVDPSQFLMKEGV